MKKQLKNNWKLFLIASLTLGLAPYREPYIWAKIKLLLSGNAFSGEHAITGIDWFDVLLHGTPWVLLITSGVLHLFKKK